MKNIILIVLMFIFLGLCNTHVNAEETGSGSAPSEPPARTEEKVSSYEKTERTYKMTCEEYPIASRLTLTVNGVSASIKCANNGDEGEDITVTRSIETEDSMYRSGVSENWGNCMLSEKLVYGKLSCKQKLEIEDVFNVCQKSRIVEKTIVNGIVDESKTIYGDWEGCPRNTPKLVGTNYIFSETILTPVVTNIGNTPLYANNKDGKSIKINFEGDIKGSGKIIGIERLRFSGFSDASNHPADIITSQGKALNFKNSFIKNQEKNGFTLNGIVSRTPFKSNNSSISFYVSGYATPIQATGVRYNFKKPVIGSINVAGTGDVLLGTLQSYTLVPNVSLSSFQLPSNYKLQDFTNKIDVINNELRIKNKRITGSLSNKEGTKFESRLDTSENATRMPSEIGIQVNMPIISYTLEGEKIAYYLSGREEADDTTPVKLDNGKFLGLKVVGSLQGVGKSEFTGQKDNFSDLTSSEFRRQIRKNAYVFIRSLVSDTLINGVQYHEGDFKISQVNPDTKTLVIKDGNLIINKNVEKTLGLIVLTDNYDINNPTKADGNVYITPNVDFIDAVIYADGSLISTNASGIPYVTDSSHRSADLSKQLFLLGSVFTRNTIGGATFGGNAGGNYLLPGGQKTQNFDLAMIYDLNYLRRGKQACKKKTGDSEECLHDATAVIQYNNKIQTNPPKLFSK